MIRSARVSAVLPLLLGVPLVFAQTPAPKPASDELIELSPFAVSSSSTKGYAASETMTGSRVKVQIADLPYSVNVLTSEFLEDFGIFDLGDNVTQIGSFTGLDVGGNFILRGFTSTNQLRDGFFRLGRYGSSNIDRIEVIKGGSAAIYGRTSPGGMINLISKQPKTAPSVQLTANYGDYDTKRFTLEAGGPLFKGTLGNTRYVLTASDYKRRYDVEYSNIHNKEYYLAIDHVFADQSKLFFSVEDFAQDRISPLSGAPMILDKKGTGTSATPDSDDVAIGYAWNLAGVNVTGPGSYLNRSNTSYTGSYEKTFNSVFSTRISGNYYKARRSDYGQNVSWGTILINPSNAAVPSTTRSANINWGRINEDGGSFQGDLLAHYWTHNKKVEHRTLITFDVNDYYRWDPTYQYGATTNPDIVAWNVARKVTLDTAYNPIAPVPYFLKSYQDSTGLVATRSMHRRTTVIGGLLRHQSSFLNGRLLAFLGVRYDSIRYREHDYLTAATAFTPFIPSYKVGDLIDKTMTAAKPNAGVNFKIRDNLRVFVNYSQSYFIAQGDDPVVIADPTFRSETAEGWDYGFKGSFFKDRLTYTLCGFSINRYNVQVADIDPVTGLTVNRRDGDQHVKGFEADVNWLMTDQLSLLISYGNVDSVYTNFGSGNPQAIGRKVQYVAPYNGSVSLKYAPGQGLLKGFSTNIGATFVGATPTESPIAGDNVTIVNKVPVYNYSSGQWKLKAPAYILWSLGMRYQFKMGGSLVHTLGFNISNVFDKVYLRSGTSGATTRLIGDHRSAIFNYSVKF
jgi:outer membrane receptor protein involved in Fe transport